MCHVGEYSPAKTGEYPRIFPSFWNRWIINTIASIWLWKYARLFVLGHYLFREAHSFPWASLSKNCSLLRTDNVRGQISEQIFAPNKGYCLCIVLTRSWVAWCINGTIKELNKYATFLNQGKQAEVSYFPIKLVFTLSHLFCKVSFHQ